MYGNLNWMRQDLPWMGPLLPEMARLRDQMDRVFRRRTASAEHPPVNVWTNADGALVTAELPGIPADKLDISVSGSTLTLRGECPAPAEALGAAHRRERARGRFGRTLDFPFQIDSAKVEARCERGIVTIRLPRADSDKPRKITVSGA